MSCKLDCWCMFVRPVVNVHYVACVTGFYLTCALTCCCKSLQGTCAYACMFCGLLSDRLWLADSVTGLWLCYLLGADCASDWVRSSSFGCAAMSLYVFQHCCVCLMRLGAWPWWINRQGPEYAPLLASLKAAAVPLRLPCTDWQPDHH